LAGSTATLKIGTVDEDVSTNGGQLQFVDNVADFRIKFSRPPIPTILPAGAEFISKEHIIIIRRST